MESWMQDKKVNQKYEQSIFRLTKRKCWTLKMKFRRRQNPGKHPSEPAARHGSVPASHYFWKPFVLDRVPGKKLLLRSWVKN